MKKILFIIKRKPGLSAQEFRDHYESTHVDLAHKYIGHLLIDYRRNYVNDVRIGSPTPDASNVPNPNSFDHDVVTEMWIEDDAALAEIARIFSDPEVGAILLEDELRFLDRASVITIVVDEVSSPPDKLMGVRAK